MHSGDSGCSLPPNSLSKETQDELREQTRKLAQGPERRRPDEHPVRHPERHHLHPRSEPARLAHGAVRFEGDERAARESGRARDGGPQARGAGRDGRARAAVLLGEGSGVPVHQVPRSRSDSRPRDEVHGRGDGHGPHVRRGVRQGADRVGRDAAAQGRRADQRARARQAGRRDARHAASSRTASSSSAPKARRKCWNDAGVAVPPREQGARRPSAHRGHDQERRDRPDREHHRGQARDPRVATPSVAKRCTGASPTTRRWPPRLRRATLWTIIDDVEVNRLQDLHKEAVRA